MSTLFTRSTVTWTLIATLEPQLEVLRREALAVGPDVDCDYCRQVQFTWPGNGPSLEQRLHRLVGPEVRQPKHPVLATPEALYVAEHVITEALPACSCCCDQRDPREW